MMIDKWYMINANAWRFHGEVFCMFWGAEAAEAVAGAWESPGRQGMPVEASGVGRKFFSNSRMQWGLRPRKVSGSQEREGSESFECSEGPEVLDCIGARFWVRKVPKVSWGTGRLGGSGWGDDNILESYTHAWGFVNYWGDCLKNMTIDAKSTNKWNPPLALGDTTWADFLVQRKCSCPPV